MTASHACMTIQWLVPVGQARSMTEALHLLMASTRGEPGCVACSVSADVAAKGTGRYMMYGAFDNVDVPSGFFLPDRSASPGYESGVMTLDLATRDAP